MPLRIYIFRVEIGFDPAKRARTLTERGLDFADVATVFDDQIYTGEDDRFDYGECRLITEARAVVVIWTEREGARHIISMRHAHSKEMSNVRLG